MCKSIVYLFIFFAHLACLQADKPTIVKKNLPNKCSRERNTADNITHIMLHFCSDANEAPENPHQIDKVLATFEEIGVSAHYLVDREGVIYELVPENRVAYHAGKGKLPFAPFYENSMNGHSIGIEMLGIGTVEEMTMFFSKEKYKQIKTTDIGFTNKQYTALNCLIEDLLNRYPTIKKDRQHIVGHDQYAPSRRTDPGSLFAWEKIGL
jgi:N-acetyl-anhydromuramyl-L-alanine amidase AmpD